MTLMIKDWVGNVCFDGKTFETFEEAWAHVYENDPEPSYLDPRWKDHWFDDYYVTEVEVES